jgi:hypothetical protein
MRAGSVSIGLNTRSFQSVAPDVNGGIGMSEAVEVVKEILRGARLLSRRVAVM